MLSSAEQIKQIKLRLKKAKNFWYLKEEADLLKGIGKREQKGVTQDNSITVKNSEEDDDCYYGVYKEGIDRVVEVREAIENLIYVAKKLPSDTSMNKELYLRGDFKNISEGKGDILNSISNYYRDYYYYSCQKNSTITTDEEFNKFVYSTSKRAYKLNDLIIFACEN